MLGHHSCGRDDEPPYTGGSVREDLEGLGSRFRLDAFVARGAWGSVYRGWDLEAGSPVAVKRLHKHLCEPTMIARFEREATLLASLDSRHVVRHVAHARDAEGLPYLVLEWLEGEDLARWKKAGRGTRRAVVDVVRQAALGLAALHRAGIVHRDVKPSNFFLVETPGGPTVKLIDLGIARATGEATLTATGFTLGTPAYMSPEQARCEPSPTPASDLFSLGVVLFELFSGRKPYRGEDMVSVATKIVLQDPPRLRDVMPGAPAAVDDLLARAMAKAPGDRFPSALAFAEALAGTDVGEEPIDAAPESDPAPSARRIVLTEGSTNATPTMWTLSRAAEQRVVSALFARFDGAGEPAPAIDAFRRATERHGGVFHRVLGPQRAAVFGAVTGRGDEALRAARAALTAARIPGVRLCVVTGRAIAAEGSLSGGLIERGLAEVRRSHGEVRVDETTARMLEGRFEIAGPKGERVLRAAEPPPDADGPRLLGRAAPLVGRDREAAALQALFDECVSEPVARAVLVTGAAGAGKSRLVYELCRRAAASSPAPVLLRGRGEALGAGAPFGMIGPAIRRLAGIVEGEPLAEQRRKLSARFAATLEGAALSHACAFLGELAHVPLDAAAAATLVAARRSALLMNDAMRAAWEDWIAAECAAHPVVIVLEDLHWGDLPSVTFVDASLRHARALPLMVVAAARPEVHQRFPGLFAGRDLDEVRLGGLTPKASEKLVRLALGAAADDGVVRRVIERAEGNAFYLEELVRAVSESPSVTRGADELPETVLGMVQARLDALGAEPRRILRAASVFGRVFSLGGVRALLGAGSGDERTATILSKLEAAEVLLKRRDSAVPGEEEYAFAHALVRDAAYATLTDDDRAGGHRLAGAWLAARGVTDADVLAEHFARGGEPEKAREHLLRAAEEALAGNDLAAAIERAARGVAGAEGEALGRLRLVQAEAHRFRGELALAEACAGEALALLPAGTPRALRAASELASAAGLLGHVERVEEAARALPEHAADPALRSAEVVCLCRAAIPLFWAGHAASRELFARVDALADPLDALDHEARALTCFSRATRALHAGRPGEHLAQQRASEAAFAAGGDRRNAVNRQVAVGFGQAQLGLWDDAEATLRAALAAGERLGIFNTTVRARNNLGPVLAHLGKLDEARAVEALAIEGCIAQGDPRLEAGSRLYLADILRMAGDLEGAAREADRALALATTAPGARARALATLARLRVAAGDAAAGRAAAEEAAALLASLGQLDEGESLVRLALAEARSASGDREGAALATEQAVRRLEERAATIADATWRDSFLAIPENARTLKLGTCDRK